MINARQEHFDTISTHQIQCDRSPDEVVDDIIHIIENK